MRAVSRRGARTAGVSLALGLVALALLASLDASRVRPPGLANTYASPEAVAAAVVTAMLFDDLSRLRSMALTEEEFRDHVWPHLPISRPDRNVPFDFAWRLLEQNSEGHLRQTTARLTEAPALRGVRFAGPTSVYGEVAVHRNAELVVIGSRGDERVIRLFGSMVEQGGRWKVFSYVVD